MTEPFDEADDEPVLICIDPALGYVMGNVAVVSALAARWLEPMTPDERRLALAPGGKA